MASGNRCPAVGATAAVALLLAASGCGSSGGGSSAAGSATVATVVRDGTTTFANQAEIAKADEITSPVTLAEVERVMPPAIVTDGDIAAANAGTPQRALLEWWQAYQFTDAAAVESLTAKATLDAVGAQELEKLVSLRGATLQGIHILGTTRSGDTATVRAALLVFQAQDGGPPPSAPTQATPATFTMERQGGAWLFDQASFIEPKLASL
jgi:hypothetical protein